MSSLTTLPESSFRFYHRAAVVEVDAGAPTRTVLEWLREDARCTGTKEGCAEGDCGACTVVVGELDAQGALRLKPINACIAFLPTLHGKALFTVEDLAAPDGQLHPVQQSLVDCHGSQCGFCTPGFAMSLWATYQRHQAAGSVPTRQALADDLSGNLCRCTGYRPILDAGQRMFSSAAPAVLDSAPVVAALRQLQQHAPPQGAGWHAPGTRAELAALRLALPQARLLAGGTDMGLWVTKQLRHLDEIIYLGGVYELQRIELEDSLIRIGAAVSLEDAWQALAAEWPSLRELWLRFASPPIRHAGTLCGNLANGSPIGDAAPALMALGATLVLQQGEAVRRVPLDAFYTGYMKNAMAPGEFICAVEVPRAPLGLALQAYKISKRFDSDISAVCAGLSLRLQDGRVAEPRLVFGGLAATVKRATAAEAALCDQPWAEPALQAAQAALAQDFSPLTDMRAGSAYRMQVAQNLLRRFWLQTRPDAPLPAAEVSVWAREPQP